MFRYVWSLDWSRQRSGEHRRTGCALQVSRAKQFTQRRLPVWKGGPKVISIRVVQASACFAASSSLLVSASFFAVCAFSAAW
jgi:hypothetical protein